MKVPYGKSVHGEEEIQAVVKVLRSSTQMGENVNEMEQRISKLFDKKYGVMVNSGTSALYLAMEVMDLPKGSEIITPACTFGTTVACIVKSGYVPVFADVEEGTYCINISQIEKLITEKTKAVLIPNLLGNIPDWKIIHDICKDKGIIIIEDSADTLGGTLRGESSGKYSDITITSFYGSHVINCMGNGGMLCVNNEDWYKTARLLRSWGRSSSVFDEKSSEESENRFNVDLKGFSYDKKFVFEKLGYQLEPSEAGAAFGLVQLDKLDQNIKTRIKYFNKHQYFFKEYEEFFILPNQTPDTVTGWLAYPLVVREGTGLERKELMKFMENEGIQTRVVMAGNILYHPLLSDAVKVDTLKYTEADKVMRGGMLLACHHGLEEEQVNYVHEKIKQFISNINKEKR